LRKQMEAAVSAERVALASEHPRRVLVLALEREYAGSERKLARKVLAHAPAQQLAVVVVLRQRKLRHMRARKRNRRESGPNLALADLHDALVAGVLGYGPRPALQEQLCFAAQRGVLVRGELVDLGRGATEHRLDRQELLALAREARLRRGAPVVAADGLRDVGEVARALRRNDGMHGRGDARRGLRQAAGHELQAFLREPSGDRVIERSH